MGFTSPNRLVISSHDGAREDCDLENGMIQASGLFNFVIQVSWHYHFSVLQTRLAFGSLDQVLNPLS